MAEVQVGIARTMAGYDGDPAIREVEQLYLTSIARAERFIYIENQYLTAHCIGETLARRLRHDDSPEVVIVMPERTGGWLEQHTMDVLRWRLVKRLRDADRRDRLRLYYPRTADGPGGSVMVHAKVMIVDDCLVRVGSSNLSNRSMGLDSECDLVIEAPPGSRTEAAIRSFRERLLGEHLGVREEQVANVMHRHGSLIATIETLRGGDRTLQPLDAQVSEQVDQLVPESALLDPERPIDPQRFVDHFVPKQHRRHTYRRIVAVVLTLTVLLALAAAWRWAGLGDWLRADAVTTYADRLRSEPATPLIVIASIALAAVMMAPLTLLVVATVLGFGPWPGFIYALTGAELGALLSYALGRVLGRDLVRRYAGARLNSVSAALSKRGALTIITLRIVPVAPFSVINLVAGASHLRLRDFALGSLVGLIPGMVVIALFADRLLVSMRSPGTGSFAELVVVVAVLLGTMLWLRRWLRTRGSRDAGTGHAP